MNDACNRVRSALLKKSVYALFLVFDAVFSDVSLIQGVDLTNSVPHRGSVGVINDNNRSRDSITVELNSFAGFAALRLKDFAFTPLEGASFWEMPGCAAFFYRDGRCGCLYVGQKRNGNNVPSNDPGEPPNYLNLFNCSEDVHTERQLIAAVLEEQSGLIYVLRNGEGMLSVRILAQVDNGSSIARLQGDLHVYTLKHPCVNPVESNRNFSCICYYNSISCFVPNVNFHIYFPRVDTRLDRNFVSNNHLVVNRLCNFVQEILEQGANNYFREHLRIEGDMLQCNRKGNLWRNILRKEGDEWMSQTSGGISTLVVQLNNCIQNNCFSNDILDDLFNRIYNFNDRNNVSYHPI